MRVVAPFSFFLLNISVAKPLPGQSRSVQGHPRPALAPAEATDQAAPSWPFAATYVEHGGATSIPACPGVSGNSASTERRSNELLHTPEWLFHQARERRDECVISAGCEDVYGHGSASPGEKHALAGGRNGTARHRPRNESRAQPSGGTGPSVRIHPVPVYALPAQWREATTNPPAQPSCFLGPATALRPSYNRMTRCRCRRSQGTRPESSPKRPSIRN